MGTTLSQRFGAALWFMLAGGIPGVCFVAYGYLSRMEGGYYEQVSARFVLLLYAIVPALLAATAGFIFGADILNPLRVKTARRAAARGLVVSLAAWALYVPVLSAVMATQSNMSFLYVVSLVAVIGSMMMGWLMAGVGALAGVLLYRVREDPQTDSSLELPVSY